MADQSSTNEPGTGGRTKRFDLGDSTLRPLRWQTVAAVLIGIVGLGVVAAMASRGLPERASEGGPAPVDITDQRIGESVAWVVIILAIAILVFTFWPSGIRRPRRPPMSVGRFLLGMAAVVVILIALQPVLPEEAIESEPEEPVVIQEADDGGARPGWTFVLLAVALAAAIGGIAMLGAGSGRRSDAEATLELFPEAAAEPDGDGDDSFELWGGQFHVDEPRRAAVVRTYGDMLLALAVSGHGRRASEAPQEYARRVDIQTTAGGPARRLTRLFEVAGFSEQPTTDDMVADAGNALDVLRRDLGEEGS